MKIPKRLQAFFLHMYYNPSDRIYESRLYSRGRDYWESFT